MKLKITETNLLLQPEDPEDLIQICAMLGDGKQRTIRVDMEAAKAACCTQVAKVIEGGLAVAQEAADLGTEAPPTDTKGGLDRKAIRAELDAMKVEYNNRWGTERLAAFLAEAKAGSAAPAAAPAPVPATPAAPVAASTPQDDPLAEPTVTKDQVLEALKKIVATKGKDEGTSIVKGILLGFGATNISGIPTDKYPAALAAAQQAL